MNRGRLDGRRPDRLTGGAMGGGSGAMSLYVEGDTTHDYQA
jgi:hypothetical protein